MFQSEVSCQNSAALREYDRVEEQQERIWCSSLEIKQEAVIKVAVDIMMRRVDEKVFELAFGKDYINVSEELEAKLVASLEDIEAGSVAADDLIPEDLAGLAIEAAAFVLYACEDSDLFETQGAYSKAVWEVLARVSGWAE